LRPILFRKAAGKRYFASERQLQNWQTVSINGAALDGSLSQFFNKRTVTVKRQAIRALWRPFALRPCLCQSDTYQIQTNRQHNSSKHPPEHMWSEQRLDGNKIGGCVCSPAVSRHFLKRKQWFVLCERVVGVVGYRPEN
jgi:hypothetical protein